MSKAGKIRFDGKSKRFYVDLYWRGKRERLYKYMGHMPCKVVEMAEFLLQDIRREIDKGIFDPERYRSRRPMHIAEYSQNWLDTLDVSAATLHDYKNSLNNHILPKLGKVFLSDITADKLKKFQNQIDRAPKGKKNVMDCLKMIFRAAHESGYISYLPTWPTLKVKKPAIRWLTQADQWHILPFIPQEDRYIFVFMMLTGCRPSEARAFRKCDIQYDHILFAKAFDRNEELKDVKGVHEQAFPLHTNLEELLDSVPRNLTPFVFLNPKTGRPYTKNINRIWNQACDDAGVKHVRLYQSTRHSFACNLLNSGIDKGIIQRLLRHSDPKMVDRYAEYATNALKIKLDNVFNIDRQQTVSKAKIDVVNS